MALLILTGPFMSILGTDREGRSERREGERRGEMRRETCESQVSNLS